MNAAKRKLADRVKKVTATLRTAYPDAECALRHANPLQLLIATILSAQCTDERVNLVTPALFAQYKTAADFANAPAGELEQLIRSTGFFRSKAKSIRNCCRVIVERHTGRVPDTMAELVQLAGCGRKTASVVLGVAYGKAEGIVVDTHVARLSRRLGFTRQATPEKIENALMEIIPQSDWIDYSHLLIWHGGNVATPANRIASIAKWQGCARRLESTRCRGASVKRRAGEYDILRASQKRGYNEESMKQLQAGTPAPSFPQLKAHAGKSVVLYFYPKDNTPGCTVESCELRDAHKKITGKNAVVLGVSPDSAKSHEKFATKFSLPFELVPDEDHKISIAYGVWKEKSMYGRKYMGIERTTFIIDPAGKIQKIFAKVKPKGHVAEVLAAL